MPGDRGWPNRWESRHDLETRNPPPGVLTMGFRGSRSHLPSKSQYPAGSLSRQDSSRLSINDLATTRVVEEERCVRVTGLQ
jgi:hypothetical protein